MISFTIKNSMRSIIYAKGNCCNLKPIRLEWPVFYHPHPWGEDGHEREPMKVTINGISKELNQALLLTDLVNQYCKNPKHVIAEVNGEIINASQWSQKSVTDGDAIELVGFVGGG